MPPDGSAAGRSAAQTPRNLSPFHDPFADTEPGSLAPMPALKEPPAQAGLELGELTQAMLRRLSNSVPHERVLRLLADCLEQEFSSGRLTQFLPVFLHRVACEVPRLPEVRPPTAVR